MIQNSEGERKETAENCTKTIQESCRLHPVDCGNCQNGDVCQQRKDMQAHPDKIKSCLHFRPKRRGYIGD